MRPLRRSVFLASLAFLLAPLTGGQQADPDRTAESAAPTYVFLPAGEKAVVRDTAGERLGAIEDYVLDRESGRVTYVALNVSVLAGETQVVLLPFGRLALDDEDHTPRLAMDLATLRSLPMFDAEAYRAAPDVEGQEPAERQAPKKLLASEVLKRPVWATSERFGKVSRLVLDAKRSTLAFLLVQEAANETQDPLLVPWSAAGWRLAPEPEDDGVLLDFGPLQLAHAPRLKAGELEPLAKEELLERVYRFYELDLPAGS